MEISQVIRRFSGGLIIMLVLAGCSWSTSPTQPSLLTFTPTYQPEILLTQIPSISPTPTETFTSIPTPTASSTPLPTSTPTFEPTLQPTQAFLALEKFLRQGMDCPSPCFFGIVPGQTTFDQAANIVNWLREPFIRRDKQEFYSSQFNYNGLSLPFTIMTENNIVKNIEIGIGLANYEGDPNPRAWQGFSPNVLVNKFGPPSQVGFDLVASPSPPGTTPQNVEYNMVMDFEPYDLTVKYELGLTKEGSILKICPLTDQFQGVRVYFGKDPANLPSSRVPLEKATSLSLKQFTELITQPSRPACFEIPKDAFPP